MQLNISRQGTGLSVTAEGSLSEIDELCTKAGALFSVLSEENRAYVANEQVADKKATAKEKSRRWATGRFGKRW